MKRSLWVPALLVGSLVLFAYLATQVGLHPLTRDYTLWQIRWPRYLLGVILGAALGMSGCLLQTLSRNPLADPEILGINQGASLAVVLTSLFLSEQSGLLTSAFVGAAGAGTLVFWLAFRGSAEPEKMLLSGLALAFFFGSLTGGLILVKENQLFELLHWMAGKLSGAGWVDVRLAVALIVPTGLACWLLAHQLDVLRLGDHMATALGQSLLKMRLFFLCCCLLWIAVAVATAGPIGFVGLVAPHLARPWAGTSHAPLLLGSALVGATLMAGSDLVAQWLLHPAEIPVGVVTALVGAPFFLDRARRMV